MARLCERPGCSAVAEIAYGFDAEQLVVWLDGFHAAQGARSGVLCLRHADAMVVPLGWMLDDRREPVPRLFRSPVDPTPRARLRRPRPQRDATGEQLRFDAVTLEQISIDAPEPDQEFVAGIRLPVVIHDDETQPVPERVTDPQVVADAEPAAGRAPLSDDESVAPWQPQFDETDDLKGLLKARGRLLSRAFNGVSADE